MNLRGLNSLTMFEKNHSKYSTVVNCDFKSDFFLSLPMIPSKCLSLYERWAIRA